MNNLSQFNLNSHYVNAHHWIGIEEQTQLKLRVKNCQIAFPASK